MRAIRDRLHLVTESAELLYASLAWSEASSQRDFKAHPPTLALKIRLVVAGTGLAYANGLNGSQEPG